ncbi:MAG: conserved phage C-terminal domain-containing protein, partial [Thermodesulfovibrionia bacterium]|nr:conserved phage C-terminal domain-containing protein [Thermodesulfovibrionia bacterium]
LRKKNMSKDIVFYLNEKLQTNYKSTAKNTQRHINARLAEGHTFENFKAVIDKKIEQWKDDPQMSKFLRPQTLFSPKFESYLNEQKTQEPWRDAFKEE